MNMASRRGAGGSGGGSGGGGASSHRRSAAMHCMSLCHSCGYSTLPVGPVQALHPSADRGGMTGRRCRRYELTYHMCASRC